MFNLRQYVPISLQILFDYEGSMVEILKAIGKSPERISVPEIAKLTPFGGNRAWLLYGHVHRMVDEGYLIQTIEKYDPVTDRARNGRPRVRYALSPMGKLGFDQLD